MSENSFTFLGTAAGTGVPSFFCDCPGCNEAREKPEYARGCCGAFIKTPNSSILVDTPPDIRHQLERENLRDFDRLIFTHMHYDHTGGFGELEYYIRLKHQENLQAYASQETYEVLYKEFGYMFDCLDFHIIEPFQEFKLLDVSVYSFPTRHHKGTLGHIFTYPNGKTVCYCPDTAALSAEEMKPLNGIDHLAWDATFWKDNLSPSAHQTVEESIAQGKKSGAKNIYLTHISPHDTVNGPLWADYQNAVKKYPNTNVAYDGLVIHLD